MIKNIYLDNIALFCGHGMGRGMKYAIQSFDNGATELRKDNKSSERLKYYTQEAQYSLELVKETDEIIQNIFNVSVYNFIKNMIVLESAASDKLDEVIVKKTIFIKNDFSGEYYDIKIKFIKSDEDTEDYYDFLYQPFIVVPEKTFNKIDFSTDAVTPGYLEKIGAESYGLQEIIREFSEYYDW